MKRTLLAGTLGVLLGLGVALYPPSPAQADTCCKHCKKGKACGDTCISKKDTCNSPPGCACDG